MTDLISRAEYKDYIGLSTATDDTKIDQLTTSISSLVKTYCGISFIDFASSAKTELINILNNNITCIILKELPILAITTLKERTSQSDSYILLEADGTNGKYDYTVDNTLGLIFRTTATGSKSFPKGHKAVEVIYTAGYTATPDDLRLAIFDLITYYLKSEHKERRSVVNSSIVNKVSSSTRDSIEFPDHIKRVLDLYKINV